MNRLSGNRLSGNRLSGNRLVLNSDASEGLEDTAEGRELLEYLAKCSLADDHELVVLADDNTTVLYSFPGLLGLAPSWENHALTTSEQRWMSACLLTHVNAFGVSVPISIRGKHPSLHASAQEKQDFPVQEGAFYGNLFEDIDGDGEADLQMYACYGHITNAQQNSPYLADRACTNSSGNGDGLTQCGFVDVGPCGKRGGNAEWACEKKANGGKSFGKCHDDTGSNQAGWPAGSETYDEVITVYLMN